MSQERQGDIQSVVEGCMSRWDSYSLPDKESLLRNLELPLSEAWYSWTALMTDTRNAIIAEEMQFLVEKYQEGYQEVANDY